MRARRLRRDQQVERNREQLLAAARRAFLERGYHAATLEAIAEAAGFSKGVVYSQFESKADLFFALLDRRIDERAAANAAIAARRRGGTSLAELLWAAQRADAAESDWARLVLEFRLHAARDPALNARYASLHARTVERLAAALDAAGGAGGRGRPGERRASALFVLAFASGATLEATAAPAGLPNAELLAMVARALGADDAATARIRRGAPEGRRSRGGPRHSRRNP